MNKWEHLLLFCGPYCSLVSSHPSPFSEQDSPTAYLSLWSSDLISVWIQQLSGRAACFPVPPPPPRLSWEPRQLVFNIRCLKLVGPSHCWDLQFCWWLVACFGSMLLLSLQSQGKYNFPTQGVLDKAAQTQSPQLQIALLFPDAIQNYPSCL